MLICIFTFSVLIFYFYFWCILCFKQLPLAGGFQELFIFLLRQELFLIYGQFCECWCDWAVNTFQLQTVPENLDKVFFHWYSKHVQLILNASVVSYLEQIMQKKKKSEIRTRYFLLKNREIKTEENWFFVTIVVFSSIDLCDIYTGEGNIAVTLSIVDTPWFFFLFLNIQKKKWSYFFNQIISLS